MRKILIPLVAAILFFAFAIPAFAGPFSDVPSDHWAYRAVNHLQQEGIIVGYPDGTFKGDNLFIDMDLRPDNLPPGQRLAIGSAVIEITAVPHTGCVSFVERYGKAAVVFVNAPKGKAMRLRGIYARVVQDGRVTVGDRVVKVD